MKKHTKIINGDNEKETKKINKYIHIYIYFLIKEEMNAS